jgi:N-acetylmuramoyl-L-alanine amidase
VPAGGVRVYSSEGGDVAYRAAEGLIFPILADDGDWLQVITTCNAEEWVRSADVEIVEQVAPSTPGPGFELSRAVIVVDPGHGGRDLGAVGATSAYESNANLAIATILRDRLLQAEDVDWETGHIRPGDQYPAVAAVYMTRGPDNPDGGDVELGLAFRAEMANRVGADVLISIHNNTSPMRTISTPGADVFYAVHSEGSDRLASLIHEELILGLTPLASEWGAADITGPKSRVDVETGEDFYGLLRRTTPPSVIVEGMYISEPLEEQILQTELGQRAYADAVYRGLIRFLTTDEYGSEIHDPVEFNGNVGSPSTTSCVVPTQS